MLAGEGRLVAVVPGTRRLESESPSGYQDRVGSALRSVRAEAAWLCVAPGDHVPLLVAAALGAGMHVLAEKPWRYSTDTPHLERSAESLGLVVGVDFEYCLLDAVQSWPAAFGGGAGLSFGGRFDVPSSNRLDLPAMDQLGSHLLALREDAAPQAAIGSLHCGYERPAVRRAWLAGPGGPVAEADFTASTEPILQRVVALFESAAAGAHFRFDLSFAERVAVLSAAGGGPGEG